MNIDEVINGWTFEETIKTAKSLMEAETNMFKWDVIRHLRDFAKAYREQLKEYQQLEEQGRLVKLPYNGNYSEKEDSALSKFVTTMIYYESLNNRLAKVFGKSDGLLEGLVKTFEDASALNVPKDTFKSVLLTNEDVDKYEEYKQLEEQDRLLKLPCKVGDTVWDNDYSRPCAYTITAFSFGECEEYICEPVTTKEAVFYYANSSGSITGSFAESEIGKSVFLNESEAEAKLKELRGNQNGKV